MGYLEDILAQPENLARSQATFAGALRETDLSAFSDGPLVFAGMGSSHFAAIPASYALRAAGRPAFAFSSTELLEPGGGLLGSSYVGVSQSGKSSETVEGMSRVAMPRLAITNDGTGPLADLADLSLPLGSAEETAVAVLTYTATLAALAGLAGALGAAEAFDPAALPELASGVLSDSASFVEEAAGALGQGESLDFVGRGPSLASAAEGALLTREAVRLPAAYTDTYQYLHGPIEVAQPGRGCVVFGSGREVALAEDLASYGTLVLLVTGSDARPRAADNLTVVRLPVVPRVLAPVLEILPIQLLSHSMARSRGLTADGFRHDQEDTKLGAG
jgi:glucosamine--fructose-6-phosphate aminotransferase (isomerizing)